MIKKLLHSEKTFVITIAAIAMLFNLAPYIYQHRINPPDKAYIGSFPIIYDKPTYLAEMIQGEQGSWKMIDMYTTEPQKPVFLYPLYLGLGHFAGISGISAENVFLISRFFFGIILLGIVLYFIRYFIDNEPQRKIAYALALFGSGVGWLSIDQKSIDLWLPDAVPIVRFSYFPHIMLANALLLISFLLIYRLIKNNNSKTAIIAGATTFLLNFVLPFESALLYVFTAFLIIILFFKNKLSLSAHPKSEANLFLIVQGDSGVTPIQTKINGELCHKKLTLKLRKNKIIFKNSLKNIMLFFIISIPSFLYMAYLGIADPVWSAVEKQNILPAPSLINLLLGYGIVPFFSIIGLWTLRKRDSFKCLFFSLWISLVFILSHIPVSLYPMQRRFIETVFYVPLAIAASFGAIAIYNYFKQKQTKNLNHKILLFSLLFILPALLFGNLQTWYRYKFAITQTQDPRFYLPAENIKAMQWLRQNSPKNSIVLASFFNSDVIPYFAGRMVYAGHDPMTVNFAEKIKKTDNFYSGKYSASEASDFMKKEKINYILYSEQEKLSEYGEKLDYFDLEEYSFLEIVYQNEKVKIYKIK